MAFSNVYHISDFGNNNNNDGLSTLTSFNTLAKVNSFILVEGNQFLFKFSDSWAGYLLINGSSNTKM